MATLKATHIEDTPQASYVWHMPTIITPVLYTFRRCPYAMRARLAIHYSGMTVELREITLKDKPVAMLDASAKGTVPVLLLQQKKVLDESLDIMLWALSAHDPELWLEHQPQALALITRNDTSFKLYLDQYKYADRFPNHEQSHYRSQGEHFLKQLESLLQQHTYLHADHPTLADYAIFPFIRQFAFVDKSWFFAHPAYPKLQYWLHTLIHSDLFSKTMLKRPLWQEDRA